MLERNLKHVSVVSVKLVHGNSGASAVTSKERSENTKMEGATKWDSYKCLTTDSENIILGANFLCPITNPTYYHHILHHMRGAALESPRKSVNITLF